MMGYRVVAATGKLAERNFLLELGGKRSDLQRDNGPGLGKTLYPERWAGVVDTVGGSILVTASSPPKAEAW